MKTLKATLSQKDGFTIVELLIVVVVIAILAAITIVSYNGITNRANASSVDSMLSTIQKKVQLYQTEEGVWPLTRNALTNDSAKTYNIPASTFITSDPTASNGKNQVLIQRCGSATPVTAGNISGLRIRYWNYTATTPAVTNLNLGTTTACEAMPAS